MMLLLKTLFFVTLSNVCSRIDFSKLPGYLHRKIDGIPVCIPIGDNQASFLGAVKPGSNVLLNVGTGSQISVLSEEDNDLPLLETPPYIRGAYLLVGSALCGGSAYRLLKDFFAQTLQDLGGVEIDDLYEKMESLRESAYPIGHFNIARIGHYYFALTKSYADPFQNFQSSI